MKKISKDSYFEISKYIIDIDILNMCCCCKEVYNKLYKNNMIWIYRIKKYINIQNLKDVENYAKFYGIVKKDQSFVKKGYTTELIRIFNECGLSFADIPIINLGTEMGCTGYIDFINQKIWYIQLWDSQIFMGDQE